MPKIMTIWPQCQTCRTATEIVPDVTAEVLDARRVVTVAAWTYFPHDSRFPPLSFEGVIP
jgi:hypothetical protein